MTATKAKRNPFHAETTSHLRWLVETFYPAERKLTTHARSLARIAREHREAREELATR